MTKRSSTARVLATVLILAMQAVAIQAFAGDLGSFSGWIVSADTQKPLAGARLLVGDPQTGEVHRSETTSPDGSFVLESLPAATYEVAVQSGDGLWVVDTPVRLAPGQSQTINLAVNEASPPPKQKSAKTSNGYYEDGDTKKQRKMKGGATFWNNPYTAGLSVFGAAVVVGVLINEATDDEGEPLASPF